MGIDGGANSPSRKGLLQIGQSMDGFRNLFGTRSSSADVARVSYGSGGRDVCEQDAVLGIAKNEHPGSKRRNSPERESVNLSTLTVQEPLTDPLDLLGRRLRIRHQKLNHAVQRPFPAPKRSHRLVYLGQRSEGGGDIARDGQCVVV